MGLFDFWKKKPTSPIQPAQEQEPKQEQKQVQKQESPVKENKPIPPSVKVLSEAELRNKILKEQLDLIENGSDGSNPIIGKVEGRFIGEFNKYFNPFRDIIVRVLKQKGILYDNNLAHSLEDYIEKNGVNEDYIYNIKGRKFYHHILSRYASYNEASPGSTDPSTQAQTRLEAFEFDIIINNETNKDRVNIILQSLNELNNLILSKYPIFKFFCERMQLLNPLDGLMEKLFSQKMDPEELQQYSELVDLVSPIIQFKIQLAESQKFYHNSIYQNLAILESDKPYEIVPKVGYDKIFINASVVLFCYLKRDEIVAFLGKEQSDLPDQANALLNKLIKPEDGFLFG